MLTLKLTEPEARMPTKVGKDILLPRNNDLTAI